jgi:SNF2 family DNA or RNA helicase
MKPFDKSELRSPDLVFDGWQDYLRGRRELDLSHATAKSHEAWFLARAALRFNLSRAVLIRDDSDIKKLETMRPQPKAHQVKGLRFFWNLSGKRAYFADDVGLGKTKTATLILHQLIEHGYVSKSSGRVLVLCPKAVIEKWQKEFLSFGIWPRGTRPRNGFDYATGHAGPWETEAEYARFIVTTI